MVPMLQIGLGAGGGRAPEERLPLGEGLAVGAAARVGRPALPPLGLGQGVVALRGIGPGAGSGPAVDGPLVGEEGGAVRVGLSHGRGVEHGRGCGLFVEVAGGHEERDVV